MVRVKHTIKHDKIHAEDCEQCKTKEGKVDQFTCEITVKGNDLLMKIASD
jgi:putative redox protein